MLKQIKLISMKNVLRSKNETGKAFFENGFFNLSEKSFIAGKTEIKLKKNIFDQLK